MAYGNADFIGTIFRLCMFQDCQFDSGHILKYLNKVRVPFNIIRNRKILVFYSVNLKKVAKTAFQTEILFLRKSAETPVF